MLKKTLAVVAVTVAVGCAFITPVQAAIPFIAEPTSPLPLPPPTTILSATPGQTMPDGSSSFLGQGQLPRLPFMGGLTVEQASRERTRAFFIRALAAPRLELVQVAFDETAGQATTYVKQAVGGVPIEGTYGVLQAREDTVRYARHRFVAPPAVNTRPQITAAAAAATAIEAMQTGSSRAGLSEASVPTLVIVYHTEVPHLAWRVTVETQTPWETRAVYIDAHDGTYLSYKKTSHDAVAGHLKFSVEPLCNGDKPVLKDMPYTQWQDEVVRYTDATGAFDFDVDVPRATVGLKSPYIDLQNHQGDRAGPWHYALQPTPADNDLEITDAPLDQVDPFFHVQTVRSWLLKHVKGKNSQTAWAHRKLRVNINIEDTCNAYFNGSLNFFQAGDGCLNTGRTAGIVYHEYGHGIHDHSSADAFADGQVGEGIADYVAATITNSPNMRGLFACDDNFRSCANDLTYCEDDCDFNESSEVHDAGQVVCAVLWELRENLVHRYGRKKGTDKADRLFLRFLALVGDPYSAYQAAIAADEDPDGDPSNGTVHSCEINKAFKNPAPNAVRHFPALRNMVPCIKK